MRHLAWMLVLLGFGTGAAAQTAAPLGVRLSVEDFADAHGLASVPLSPTNLLLRGAATRIALRADSRLATVNQILLYLNAPAAAIPAGWTLARADLARVLQPIVQPRSVLYVKFPRVIVLDPGHGGADSGAIGPHRSVWEKKVVLDVAKRAQDLLDSEGYTVHLTRTRDTALTLPQRAARARQLRADLLVSIHINSAANPAARGVETYVLPAPGFASSANSTRDTAELPGNRFDAANSLLAYLVHKELLTALGTEDRGIRRARFDVLAQAPCPAILVEFAFVSNATDEANLLEKAYRQTVARAVATGVRRYADLFR